VRHSLRQRHPRLLGGHRRTGAHGHAGSDDDPQPDADAGTNCDAHASRHPHTHTYADAGIHAHAERHTQSYPDPGSHTRTERQSEALLKRVSDVFANLQPSAPLDFRRCAARSASRYPMLGPVVRVSE